MSDHYVYHALAINPAYSGSHDALSTTVLYRNHWTGFKGCPTTMSLSIHTPLANERIGLGFLAMNDNIGVTRETSFIGNYAYRMDLGYGKLAFGLGAGMIFCCTDWNKLAAADIDDELLIYNSSTGIMPDFSVGIYYTTQKYFMGLSVPLFLSHEFDSKANKYIIRNSFKEYNYFYNAGYIFDINSNIRFFPSLLCKYHKGNSFQIDINSQIIFKNRIWSGISYRSNNILVGMLQCQINKQLRIAYSHDFVIGKLGHYKNNLQEFMINYIFKYSAEVTGPRQF
ncbi:hypothetical protein AC481_07260 [miscellaneous Crenarchaeota group archaeon SMTZ-80]|nr:MAG: hypothetical protein AC481_07260 [miscellaneous Crenarchaeota group archaeon SMTZ-80]